MSYYNQQQPPVPPMGMAVPPPQGIPAVEGIPKVAYPLPGYPPQPLYGQPPTQDDRPSFFEGCLAAMCCCCLLDACL